MVKIVVFFILRSGKMSENTYQININQQFPKYTFNFVILIRLKFLPKVAFEDEYCVIFVKVGSQNIIIKN